MQPAEIETLKAELADPEKREQAAKALAAHWRGQKEPRRLAEALEALAIATREPAAEAKVLVELARVRLCELGAVEEALLAFARAVYLAPSDNSVTREFRDAATQAKKVAELKAILEDVLTDAPDAARAALQDALAKS